MRLLVDESLPRGLKRELSSHDVATVAEKGWAGRSNGELLELAEDDFDVFLTADQGVPYQQNLSRSKIAFIILTAKTNRLEDLRPPFVKPLLNERFFRTQQCRSYRSGGFREFLVVDSDGRRIKGRTLGIERLDCDMPLKFGVVTGIQAGVLNTLFLDPPVSVRYQLDDDGKESLQDTKERIYKYIRLNPRHYQRTNVGSLRQRVAATNMEVLVNRFIED